MIKNNKKHFKKHIKIHVMSFDVGVFKKKIVQEF